MLQWYISAGPFFLRFFGTVTGSVLIVRGILELFVAVSDIYDFLVFSCVICGHEFHCFHDLASWVSGRRIGLPAHGVQTAGALYEFVVTMFRMAANMLSATSDVYRRPLHPQSLRFWEAGGCKTCTDHGTRAYSNVIRSQATVQQ